MSREMTRKHYVMLGVNMFLSAIVMYVAMYSMIWSLADFFNNLNMFYMALIMWAPMGALMLITMASMYSDKKLNIILYAGFALLLALSFFAMRDQSLVGDRQFLRAMIPHHSGALTMCNRASIKDAEIRQLCFKPNGIVESQTREIKQMNGILNRL